MVLRSALTEFKPAWWCPSAHAQTIWAAIQRPIPDIPVRHEHWETPDDDFLLVDHVTAAPGRPILVVLHGLESSSQSKQVRGFLSAAHSRGWRAFGINFRSCGAELNRTQRSYHAGETSDFKWAIKRITAQYPRDALFCVGVSLGGNVLLKYLGEQGSMAPPTIKAAAAISTPFDLASAAFAFEKDFINRRYMRRLIHSLKEKIAQKLKKFPNFVDPKRLALVRTIAEFDEAVTAPLNGFADARSYWKASSCRQFLPAIGHPTLLINAMDDPLVPAAGLPHAEIKRNSNLTALITQTGGHMGFISGRWPSRPTFWAEQKTFTFFEQHL